jgi:hypothetical protein
MAASKRVRDPREEAGQTQLRIIAPLGLAEAAVFPARGGGMLRAYVRLTPEQTARLVEALGHGEECPFIPRGEIRPWQTK